MYENDNVTLSQLADSYEQQDNTTDETATVEVEVVEATDLATTDATDLEAVEPAAEPEQPVVPVVKEKKAKTAGTGRVGRPKDVDGTKTVMGKARRIYADNPTFTNTQLRDAIVAATNCSAAVASTYASKIKNNK